MNSRTKPESVLLASAAALVEEMQRHESAVDELRGIRIDSEQSLQQAQRTLQACGECEESLATQLTALVRAMGDLQERQQKCLEATLAAADHIQRKANERNALLQGIARLGETARSITGPLADTSELEERIATAPDPFNWLEDVSLCIDSLIGEAQTIGIAAENTTWIDIASESEMLTRQLQTARNNVLIMQRAVSSRHLS
jgi:hypothetical protein